MDWKQFFLGVGFLAAGYWLYSGTRRKSIISEDYIPNPSYIRDWGGVIMAAVAGILLIIRSISW